MAPKKLSVVVPCFNAQETLGRCVEAILHSSYPNIEIILINDGSLDQTEQMVDSMAQKYPNVFAYSKSNEGLGKTRNYGIARARGELVTFVDSDDYVDEQMYSSMISQMMKDEADVVYCGFLYEYSDSFRTDEWNCKAFYDDSQEFLTYVMGKEKTYAGISACTGIYKKELLDRMGECFYSERVCLSEDKLFNYRYIKQAHRISVINHPYYHYVQHQTGTLTTSFQEYKFDAAYNMYRTMMEVEENALLQEMIRYDFMLHLSACYQMIICSNMHTLMQKLAVIAKMRKRKHYADVMYELNAEALDGKSKIFRLLITNGCAPLIYVAYVLKIKRSGKQRG